MFLKDLYIHIFKNSVCPPGASVFVRFSSALLLSSVCSFCGTIHWVPARLSETGGSPGCRWLEIQPEISVLLMNHSLHLTPNFAPGSEHNLSITRQRNSVRVPESEAFASRSSGAADGEAVDWCKSNTIRNYVLGLVET